MSAGISPRLQAVLLGVLLAAALVGCGSRSSPASPAPAASAEPQSDSVVTARLKRAEAELGVSLQRFTQFNVPKGVAVFYRYTRGATCGVGYMIIPNDSQDRGSSGRGSMDCNREQLITRYGFGTPADQDPMSGLYGEINDPRIARVVVTFESNETVTAGVQSGIWAVLFPGRNRLPAVKQVVGQDEKGKQLFALS